jgi:biotin carboxyl carrier protein
MPGIVTKVLVSEGSQVEAGQIVAAIEAMKMENNITATRSARVKKVHVKPGVEVQGQQLLIELS